MARILNRLIGHSDLMDSLHRASSTGRLASALLFAGPGGVGKKLAAQALAQSLICEKSNGAEACGECASCLRVEKGQSENLLLVEPESAQIKIEQSRDIIRWLSLQKMGRSRIVIIDQAHLLNPQAANSLLKSLEEPPTGTYFILITPLIAAVLPTIRSRSQLVRFGPLSKSEIRKVIGEEADEWVVEASLGSIEAARKMMDDRDSYLEIEGATLNFLNIASERFPGEEIQNLRDLIKDKASQSFMTSLIQSVIRDAYLMRGGQKPRGAAKWNSLSSKISVFSNSALESLSQRALLIEKDLSANVDRGLILENFAIQWRER